jgi:hypothetical protein
LITNLWTSSKGVEISSSKTKDNAMEELLAAILTQRPNTQPTLARLLQERAPHDLLRALTLTPRRDDKDPDLAQYSLTLNAPFSQAKAFVEGRLGAGSIVHEPTVTPPARDWLMCDPFYLSEEPDGGVMLRWFRIRPEFSYPKQTDDTRLKFLRDLLLAAKNGSYRELQDLIRKEESAAGLSQPSFEEGHTCRFFWMPPIEVRLLSQFLKRPLAAVVSHVKHPNPWELRFSHPKTRGHAIQAGARRFTFRLEGHPKRIAPIDSIQQTTWDYNELAECHPMRVLSVEIRG